MGEEADGTQGAATPDGMSGITFDAGALIALERRRPRARRGDVATSDFEDLERLRAFFRSARVLAI